MSDNIPVEIQPEILKWLPVKSLIQFRSVSKTWKSHIDNSDFIKDYSGRVQHLLIRYEDRHDDGPLDYNQKYVSIVNDHTFPPHRIPLPLPQLVKNLKYPKIIGSSNGLLGLYISSYSKYGGNGQVVIWNPSINKSVAIVMPNVKQGTDGTAIGFGVCRETRDPKIVKVSYISTEVEVEVFTLSTWAWRRSNGNRPRDVVRFNDYNNQVVIDGVIYWLANNGNITGRNLRYMIVSFDMTSEEFKELSLPDCLARHTSVGCDLFLSKLGESLVVVGQDERAIDLAFGVWMMGDGDLKLFTKVFSFTTKGSYIFKGFRKSGDPIVDVPEQGYVRGQLAVYKPSSKRIDNLGIDGLHSSFYLYDYMESLLLLDQP